MSSDKSAVYLATSNTSYSILTKIANPGNWTLTWLSQNIFERTLIAQKESSTSKEAIFLFDMED